MVFLLDSHASNPSNVASFAQMLAMYPGGAYTTLAIRKNKVLELRKHVQRLTRNVEKLHAEKGSFLRCVEHGRAKGQTLPDAVHRGLATMLSTALSTWPVKDVERGVVVLALCDANPEASPTTDGYLLPAQMGVCLHDSDADIGVATQVYVMGPPRVLPQVKNTEWPEQRHGWQSRLPAGAAEGLLWDPEGLIQEGFTTNFFVIVKKKDPNGNGEARMLQTAPEENVLAGIVRSKVLQACDAIGIPVILSPPDAKERATWVEAFVCNSLRHIQPVQSIICNGDDVWGAQPWEWQTEGACPGTTTAKLQDELCKAWRLTPIADLAASPEACYQLISS